MNELKPCPFCGSAPEAATYTVNCINPCCEAQPFTAGQSQSEAITAWNRRAALPVPAASTEPVAWMRTDEDGIYIHPATYERLSAMTRAEFVPLYATPPSLHPLGELVEAAIACIERWAPTLNGQIVSDAAQVIAALRSALEKP